MLGTAWRAGASRPASNARPGLAGPAGKFVRRAWRDRWVSDPRAGDPEAHLAAAESWLARAHDAGGDGGVSYGYSLRGGWRAPYPETSGYIAVTFLELAQRRGDPRWRARALAVCRWLLQVQNADGSIANPRFGPRGLVFDTGQVLCGLVAAYRASGDAALLHAARRAGDWLVAVADAQGRWTRGDYLDTPHVYNTRTAWALLQLDRLDGIDPQPGRERVARANLDWALAAQQPSGFFEHCGFRRDDLPFTHTLAYAVEGLLECGALLGDPRYGAAAARCLDAARGHLGPDGFLPGRIAPDGRSAARFSCLSGNSQFALCWARLGELQGDVQHLEPARRALRHVMAHQPLDGGDADTRGAIAGSFPVWGAYAPMSFPNWAAKFFIDAMWRCKAGDAWAA